MRWFKKERHVHQWSPLQVRQGTIEMLGSAGTQILLRCECGEYSTQTIHGHWELEEVRSVPREDELAELRRIAGL
jgi:hypothetical protein